MAFRESTARSQSLHWWGVLVGGEARASENVLVPRQRHFRSRADPRKHRTAPGRRDTSAGGEEREQRQESEQHAPGNRRARAYPYPDLNVLENVPARLRSKKRSSIGALLRARPKAWVCASRWSLASPLIWGAVGGPSASNERQGSSVPESHLAPGWLW